MLYELARPLLFALDAENAHTLTLMALARVGGLLPSAAVPPTSPVRVMGIDFPNRVGLAAGLDKNGEAIDGLARLGFGFIEIGTVTPRPQPGNPRPRMFRLPEVRGIINRMGFNNHGVDALIANVSCGEVSRRAGHQHRQEFRYADRKRGRRLPDVPRRRSIRWRSYVTVNISSPNTKNLRAAAGRHANSTACSARSRWRNSGWPTNMAVTCRWR